MAEKPGFDLAAFEVSAITSGGLMTVRSKDGLRALLMRRFELTGLRTKAVARALEADLRLISHPSNAAFLRLLEIHETGPKFHYLFERRPVEPISELIRRGGPLHTGDALHLADLVAAALETLPAERPVPGWILAPGCVLHTPDDHVVLEPPLALPSALPAATPDAGPWPALARLIAFTVTGQLLEPAVLADAEAQSTTPLAAATPALRGLVMNLAQVRADLERARRDTVPRPLPPPAPKPARPPAATATVLPKPRARKQGQTLVLAAAAAVVAAGLFLARDLLPRRTPLENIEPPAIAPAATMSPADSRAAAPRPAEAAPAMAPATSVASEPAAAPEPDSIDTLVPYCEMMTEVFRLAGQRAYREAAAAATQWVDTHPGHPLTARAASDAARMGRVAAWMDRLAAGSPAAKGLTVRLPDGSSAPVEALGRGRVGVMRTVAAGQVLLETPLADLDAATLSALAGKVCGGEATAASAGLLLAAAQFSPARKVILDAELRGEDIREAGQWEADWRQVWGECQVLAAYRRAEQLARAGSTIDAGRLWQRTRELYRASELLAMLDPRVTEALAAAERAAPAAAAAAVTAVAAAPDPGYPGLPPLTDASLLTAAAARQIEQTTRAVVDGGRWAVHQQALRDVVVKAAVPAAPYLRQGQFERVLTQPAVVTLLGQYMLTRRIGADRLMRVAADEHGRNFLRWLMASPETIEFFLRTLAPEDRLDEALEVWRRLWEYHQEDVKRYPALAIACALVYDDPPPGTKQGADTIFGNFSRAAKEGKLKVELEKLPPWELVWVVDVDLPDEEIAWARTHVRYSRGRWGETYGDIEYRMDRAVNGVNPFTNGYTLAAIKKEGGICADQAYYAANTAKANGIPAMVIAGTGQRGGHAWLGFKESTQKWNLEVGRYSGDLFAAGSTRNPQTGRTLKEHELRLMADPGARNEAGRRADLLNWLAALLDDAGRREDETVALQMALRENRRDPAVWDRFFEVARDQGGASAALTAALRDYRDAFRDYPDLLVLADRLQLELAVATGGDAADVARLQTRKLLDREADRTDLYLESLKRQIDLLTKAGRTNDALKVYGDALDKKGEEVVAFRALARPYYDVARTAGKGHAAARDLENAYDRHHSRKGDYFRETTRVGLMELLAGILADDGQTAKADRMRRDAEKALAAAKEPWDLKKFKKGLDETPADGSSTQP